MINGSNKRDGTRLRMRNEVRNIMIYYHHYITQIRHMERFKNVGWALQLPKVKNEDDKIEMYVKKEVHYNHIRE